MSEHPQKFYVTTPIYYVNARPHIGHAYTTIVADVLARRHRLLGEDTLFLTGTDEHGQKIERSAAAAGVPPQQFADQVSSEFRTLWDRMGLTYDRYIRTTDPKHKTGVQKLFTELYDRGHIYLDSYTGAYCVSDEAFVDVQPGQPCPDCGRITEIVTEENFFFRLSAFQRPLLDVIESNTLMIENEARRNEVLSFLRGNVKSGDATSPSNLSSRPEAVGRSGETPVFADASATGTSLSALAYSTAGIPYVPGTLKDLSVSRSSFTWGIPVPEEIQRKAGATKQHVVYVWLDALANYITAIGYGSDTPQDKADFAKWWPADLHLVGKEIIRFHCVYWPAFLLALNPEPQERSVILSAAPSAEPKDLDALHLAEVAGSFQPQTQILPEPTFEQNRAWAAKMLPKAITGHGWLLFDNSKMSKSKGNIVRTETILDAFGQLCPPPPSVSLKGTASAVPQEPQQEAALAAEASSVPSPLLSSFREAGGSASPIYATNPEEKAEGALKGTGVSPSINEPTRGAALAAEGTSPTPHERDLFASDILRYFLLREIPFGQDGSFSFDAMITRYNADLVNGYGNLVSRTLKMISTYFDGVFPSFASKHYFEIVRDASTDGAKAIAFGSEDEITRKRKTVPSDVSQWRERWHSAWYQSDSLEGAIAFDFQQNRLGVATEATAQAVAAVDQYLTANAPWKTAKDTSKRELLAEVLVNACEAIRYITALLYPILPYATARVWSQLGLGDIEEAARYGDLKNLRWGGLKPGTKLGPLGPIFPRADKGLAQIMIDMENERSAATTSSTSDSGSPQALSPATPQPVATDPTDPAAPPRTSSLDEPSGTLPVAGSASHTTHNGPTPSHAEAQPSGIFGGEAAKMPITAGPSDASPQITIDDFAKVELRVAQIVVCERIPKADKLLRLEVDLGYEKRQILSGIAEWYTPEDLVGRRIVVITNLAPRKMRGLESHGMLLAASEEGGKPVLATFGEDIALGARLK